MATIAAPHRNVVCGIPMMVGAATAIGHAASVGSVVCVMPSGQRYIPPTGDGAIVGGATVGVSCMPVDDPGAGAAAAHCDESVTTEPSAHVYVAGVVGARPAAAVRAFAAAVAAAAVCAIADGHDDGSVTCVMP